MPIKRLLAALLGVFLVLAPGPAWGLTVAQERELGEKFMQEVFEKLPLVHDPAIVGLVEKIGANIMQTAGPQPFEYRFFVADMDVFNAFAGPAGNIFFNRGLITALENEGQLAGIVAHEVAHGISRHIASRLAREQKIQLASVVGAVAALLLGAGPAGLVGPLAAGQSLSLAYSREDERQADQIGMEILTRAGYGGSDFLDAMTKMRAASWWGPQQVPTYLTTHPGADERIVYLDTWVAMNPEKAMPTRKIDPYFFDRAKSRTMALFEEPAIARSKLESLAREQPENAAFQYGLALAFARLGNRDAAMARAEKALQLKPFDPFVLAIAGRLYFETGNSEKALASLQAALGADPENAEANLWLGRVYLNDGNLDTAAMHLEKAVDLNPKDSLALYTLGQALGRRGDMAKAHYYLGRYHLGQKDMQNALFHLNRARELAAGDTELLEKISKVMPAASRR
ncbi:MAG: M48 family metalloprotease [Desulfatibacillaceae bacterium]|nr:M48 family metalloprotease [Desulfatibacillaceae bacterium]